MVPPDGKALLGFIPDWRDTPQGLNGRLVAAGGLAPGALGMFVHTPMRDSDRHAIQGFMERAMGAIVVVTAEPFEFDAFNASDAEELAGFCQRFEEYGGSACIIRFMHEMNGGWYPWCQKPSLFKEKFRLMATKLYQVTRRSGMVWSVNGGDGYPFLGGQYTAKPSDPWYHELDTNGDGKVTLEDDMYEPFYPGDDVVDWVGITLYHWGDAWPWGENDVPENNVFVKKLRGNYVGYGGDARAVPDFYARYCEGSRKKPLMLTETAALYVEGAPFGGKGSEMEIRRNWWKQVYGIHRCEPSVLCGGDLPQLKMINWFDIVKEEAAVDGNVAKWGFTQDTIMTRQFVQDVLGSTWAQLRYVGLNYVYYMKDQLISQQSAESR